MKKLLIEHITLYDYEHAVILAQHLAYLKPQNHTWQKLILHELVIEPDTDNVRNEIDAFGNHRTFFSISRAHKSLEVRATSEVLKKPRFIESSLAQTPAWESVRNSMHYSLDQPFDPASEFVWPSPYIPWVEELKSYAKQSFTASRPIGVASLELCERIYDDFKYEAGATEIHTPLEQAFVQRKGVCQDFAHIMIGCLRAIGLPAKYISGYLLTSPPPGMPRLRGADASHAWLAVYCPSMPGQWLELDPTNRTVADLDHVSLAQGRDFGDVSPLRGVIRGGGTHEYKIAVTVEDATLAQPTVTVR